MDRELNEENFVTLEEAGKLSKKTKFTDDFNRKKLEAAVHTGKITVYSNEPIQNETFISTSANYVRSRFINPTIYFKTLNTCDTEWKNALEGRYNPLRESKSKIYGNMSDEERYRVLRDRKIKITAIADDKRVGYKLLRKINRPECHKWCFKAIVEKISNEFSVTKEYYNEDCDFYVGVSNTNMSECISKQNGNYKEFLLMLTCLDKIIENAIGIEIHNRNDINYKFDPTLTCFYVLISAYVYSEMIIPVRLEVKEFWDKNNTLHLALALEGIKIDEIRTQGIFKNDVAQYATSSEVSLAQFVSVIKDKEDVILKYLPKQFLL